ncbi:MAG: hypothetical protein H5U17_05070 [Defluviimonas sp.]|nr:hypothetical protein [Defluviimonas sp.]
MTASRVKLDIDATREKLAALGLGHAVDALEGLLSEAVRNEMPGMSSSTGCSTPSDPAARNAASARC